MRLFANVVVALVVATTFGCQDKAAPAEPDLGASQRREIEAAALKVVEAKEDWAAKAEFRIKKDGDNWIVTAWRVENPAAQGNLRYVPWGSRTMVLDRRLELVEYRSGPK